jgi:hypothetical protein
LLQWWASTERTRIFRHPKPSGNEEGTPSQALF